MRPGTKDQLEGMLHEAKGKVKESAGILTDNPKLESEGVCKKVAGKIAIVMVGLLATVIFATADSASASSGMSKPSASAKSSAANHVEARIKQLQTAIKITGAQEVLWNNLTKVMRDNAKEMDLLTSERAANIQSMNAVEEMKFHLKVTEAQAAQLEEFIPVFEALYVSMSDEQKMSSDTLFRTGRQGKHKRK